MRDELFDRDYQAGRSDFHAGIDRGFARIAGALSATFKTLHRIQWNAPWVRDKDVGHA